MTAQQPGSAAQPRRIVVGVDGSPASRAALRWAARIAPQLGATIDAVLVYSPVPALVFAPAGAGALAVTGGEEDLAAAAAAQLTRAVQLAGVAPLVHGSIAEAGHAWQALVERSAAADMLVVGHHHHRAFDAVMGSTARSCVVHARCPVVVVPEDTRIDSPVVDIGR